MKRIFLVSLLFTLNTPIVANAADWHLSTGIEYYNWVETDIDGSELVEEQGPRVFLEIGGREEAGEGDILTSFISRIYMADVVYDGETTGTTSSPVSFVSESIYAGWAGEINIDFLLTDSIHTRGDQTDWYFSLGTGYEAWLRDIQSSKTVSGYAEFYRVPYVKLGFVYDSIGSTDLRMGLKYPLKVEEDIGFKALGFKNPQVEPEPLVSMYLTWIMQFSKSLGMHFFYDSYRFGESPKVDVYNLDGTPATYIVKENGIDVLYQRQVSQPDSVQHSVGLLISYHF